jgi:dethiobiotin synthetase
LSPKRSADVADLGPGLFFTGTDTGVGKTAVAAAVVRCLRRAGRPVAVCKPVASGAALRDGRLVGDDTLRLAEAAGLPAASWERVTPFVFAEPLAPPVAARRRGQSLRLEPLVSAVRAAHRPGATLVVEGVGGLLCPLTDQETVADFARELGLPLVVVARRSLGTLNHTLLTLEAARTRGLPVAGVVVNETTPPEGVAEETNVTELERWGVPVLAVAPHRPGATADELAGVLAEIDWRRLSGERAAPEEEMARSCRR